MKNLEGERDYYNEKLVEIDELLLVRLEVGCNAIARGKNGVLRENPSNSLLRIERAAK